jgi:hypothetical protein
MSRPAAECCHNAMHKAKVWDLKYNIDAALFED